MARRDTASVEITPEVLLKAYACGIFPMAESAEDPALYWIEPEQRGVIPLDALQISSRLARTIRSERFRVVADRDFEAVVDGCAEPGPGRTRTWINTRIRKLYGRLFEIGRAHTVEVYDGDTLVGGLYGVSLGCAFFGESMFHRSRDASKVALVHLVARLRAGGFRLLDTQFVTDHLRRFGAVEVSRRAYHKLLAAALVGEADFAALPVDQPIAGARVLELARPATAPAAAPPGGTGTGGPAV
ncbi:MAG: leucyl/phenylalanyl-tRNA--protein transferase [Rhodoplanes sp.]|uniref:leucyl/phenylalanyl-tRNA--protein transferase n=1 Tax=Rhodoplanes sp. TaxID=1968906 RepID=UPI0018274474|nr:leucyl/phenylalanyl-tRNA--protein transferase [Rhodoplanes sp.]NVO13799.1 leucyl/phenylalanyl-tRNA--protein transferase [Rhodoplanes sp.]